MVGIAWTMFELFINLVECVLISYFSLSICYIRFQKNSIYKFVITTFILASVITCINFNVISFEGWFGVFYIVEIFIILCLFTDASIIRKLFTSVAVNLLLLMSSSLVMSFFGEYIEDKSYLVFNKPSVGRFFLLILSKVILFYLIIVIEKLNKKNGFLLTLKEWLLITSVLIITFILMILLRFMHYNANGTERIIVLFALEFGLILINIICFYMVVNLSKSNKQNMDNKLIEEKIETHSKHLEKIRQDQEEIFAIKHDLKSNLQVINNLLRQGKYEKAIDYLSEYEESKVFIANETYTDNDMINAVLADKFSLARKQGIEISYQISTGDLLVRDTDICSLLSNMLDNAIEGCSSRQETQQKSIKLLMNNIAKQLVISAQNTVAESVLDKNPDLQTSKKGKHGYGTKIIRSIAKAYNGDVDFYEEDGLFICRVTLS